MPQSAEKQVLALEPLAVGGEPPAALVRQAEARRGSRHGWRRGSGRGRARCVRRDTSRAPASATGPSRVRSQPARSRVEPRRPSGARNGTTRRRRWRRSSAASVERAACEHRIGCRSAGAPQLTMMRCAPLENSKERQLAAASADEGASAAARPTSATSERAARLQALVAGMRRVMDRLAAHVVVGEQRREVVGGGDAHAVEMRQGAVAMPEEAHHRQHPVDGARAAPPACRLRGWRTSGAAATGRTEDRSGCADCGSHGRRPAGSGGRARGTEAASPASASRRGPRSTGRA